MLLRGNGRAIYVAHDGTKALGLNGERAPEIVFLDIGAPFLNGDEVWPMIIIALTGGQENYRRRAGEAGFDEQSRPERWRNTVTLRKSRT